MKKKSIIIGTFVLTTLMPFLVLMNSYFAYFIACLMIVPIVLFRKKLFSINLIVFLFAFVNITFKLSEKYNFSTPVIVSGSYLLFTQVISILLATFVLVYNLISKER